MTINEIKLTKADYARLEAQKALMPDADYQVFYAEMVQKGKCKEYQEKVRKEISSDNMIGWLVSSIAGAGVIGILYFWLVAVFKVDIAYFIMSIAFVVLCVIMANIGQSNDNVK